MGRHRACDICRALKEKCVFSANASPECERCRRLCRACSFSRPVMKVGRRTGRRNTLDLPFAFQPVWSSPSLPCAHVDQGVEGGERKREKERGRRRKPVANTNTTALSPATVKAANRRARRRRPSKSRSLAPDSPSLDVVPTSLPSPSRPVIDVGTFWPDSSRSVAVSKTQAGPSSWESHERQLLSLFLNSHTLSLFTIDDSFAAELCGQIDSSLRKAPHILRDPFLACAASVALDQNMAIQGLSVDTVLRYVSRSVEMLRYLEKPRDLDGVLNILAIYIALMTHMLLTPAISQARLITEYTLDTIQPWYADERSQSEHFLVDCHMVLAVAEDVSFCLLHRKEPAVQYVPTRADIADKYMGLCKTLLPILQQICELGSRWKSAQFDADGLSSAWIALQSWQPTLSTDFMSKYTSSGAGKLLAQARAYQGAAVIILHRLDRCTHRLPPADTHSLALLLLVDIDVYTRDMVPTSMPLVMLPIMIAGLEVRDQSAQALALRCLERYSETVYRHSQKRACAFLKNIWRMRDSDPNVAWEDVIDSEPQSYSLL